jgi:replicative DNA helicase
MPPTIEGRVPPHDLGAEEAVLSACMLDKQALDRVAEFLKPEHFYSEANRRIFEACMDLHQRDQPVDTIQVATWLRDRDRLTQIGGPPYLAKVVMVAPPVGNVAAYGQTIYAKWRVRQLILTCQRVSAQGYLDYGEAQEFIDGAEQEIYDLARIDAKNSLEPLNELIRRAFKQLSDAAARGTSITGVPTGFERYDRVTSGLHPGDLTIVAARPGMGKTSLVLNIAVNVASATQVEMAHDPNDRQVKPGYGCAVFSLEMPREQIANRMLALHAKVDVSKLRSGLMTQQDWQRLTGAASELSRAPIWIDDSPGLSILELRAKMRRLQVEQERAGIHLGLVIIDYLQLMRGRDGVNSREQEISEISRGLKGLAKELKLPVIALSQLNRSVETRSEKSKRPQLSDLRECVTGDTLVLLADGRRAPIRDLVGACPRVLAVDGGRIVEADADKVWSVGTRDVVEVRLASGRRLRATSLHRLYAAKGWTRVEDLVVGDRVALAREVPHPRSAGDWSDAHIVLLGHLIGDGSYLVHQPMRYTTASEANSAAVADAARAFGVTVTRHAGRGAWHQLVFSGNGNRWHPAGINRWLRELGIYGQRSHEKRVPASAFSLDARQTALLLRHLWATDGCISVRPPGARGAPAVFFSTNSRRLADDVAALLLRFGIVARIREVMQAKYRALYNVVVSGATAQARFLERIGAFGPRELPAERLRRALEGKLENTNGDTLPRDTWGRVKETMRARGISQRRMAMLRGTAYGGDSHYRFAPSRDVALEYAELLDDAALREAATSQLFWDRIEAITPTGQEEVFDLTVPGPSSWLADGIVSHNSGAIEQDADNICFIYRDDYYNKDSQEQNVAELIIAKQRNGPTTTVKVRFDKQYTRFDNLAEGEYTDEGFE